MKAPDKIYVSYEHDYFVPADGNKLPNQIEYVRTDAILNWVKEQESCLTVSSISSDAFQLAFGMLKEKLSKL